MESPDDRDGADGVDLGNGMTIDGFVDDGYGQIMDTFVGNFRERGDLGAGCAVYVDGRLVADLWGGLADRRTRKRWSHETTAVIFSCSKGVLAICAYLLVQKGHLDLDARQGRPKAEGSRFRPPRHRVRVSQDDVVAGWAQSVSTKPYRRASW